MITQQVENGLHPGFQLLGAGCAPRAGRFFLPTLDHSFLHNPVSSLLFALAEYVGVVVCVCVCWGVGVLYIRINLGDVPGLFVFFYLFLPL